MKIIRSMLTASLLFSVLLSGCSIPQAVVSETETELPPIEISTIPVETQPVTEQIPQTEQPVPETELPVTEPVQQTVPPSGVYNTVIFDKAIFAALLKGAAGDHYTDSFYVGDVDNDGFSELVVSMPYSQTISANLIFDHYGSAGLYYYGATGVDNDFFVVNPTTGDVYLNENTRSSDGEAIISREYFKWKNRRWDSACMLYGSRCYWDYEDTSSDSFMNHVSELKSIRPAEDIFNIYVTGTAPVAAEEFYKYLLNYFPVERPLTVDIDGDGSMEQVLFIQNMARAWCANIRNLYDTEGYFNTEPIQNMYTTCFVIDIMDNDLIRIRCENFDRKYTFKEINNILFAYDENNTLQTFQYSKESNGINTQFMSMVKMWE